MVFESALRLVKLEVHRIRSRMGIPFTFNGGRGLVNSLPLHPRFFFCGERCANVELEGGTVMVGIVFESNMG